MIFFNVADPGCTKMMSLVFRNIETILGFVIDYCSCNFEIPIEYRGRTHIRRRDFCLPRLSNTGECKIVVQRPANSQPLQLLVLMKTLQTEDGQRNRSWSRWFFSKCIILVAIRVSDVEFGDDMSVFTFRNTLTSQSKIVNIKHPYRLRCWLVP